MSLSYVASPVWFGYSGTPALVNPPKHCVLVDLDGTLLNNEHRQHFMEGPTKKWAQFFDAMHDDVVYPEVKMIIDLIFKHSNVAIMLCTGRPSQYHGATLQTLHDQDVSFTSLIMRAQKDNRSDVDVKRDMLRAIRYTGFEPIMCIDDRPEVVGMWRSEGIRTLQCDPSVWDKQALRSDMYDKLGLLDEVERLRARVIELEDQIIREAHYAK